jgi:chromosome segregation ATPase
MATKIDSPEQELAVLKTKFQKLLGMLKQVTAENETLRNQINIEEKKNQNEDNNNDENENNENFDPIQAQNLKLIEENANLVQENTKNVSENAKLKDILFKLKQKHLENTDQITTLKEENGQFRLKIAQLESSIQDSEGSIRRNNDTSAEITTLTNQLNTSQASIDALLKEKRQLTDNVAELERQMGELNEKIEEERQEKDEQIAENELKLRNLSEELSQTKSSLQTSQTQVTSLQKLNIEQQGQLAQFESIIVQLETKIDNVNTSNRTTETVATELHAALSQNNSLTKANDALKKLQEKVERDHQDEIWLLNQTHLGEIEARQNQMVMELNERDIIIQNLN